MSAPFVPQGVTVLSIGDLTRQVKGLIEGEFPEIWVSGEVSNLGRPSSGHLYLTLKDSEAQLRTVIYRGVALRLKFDLKDGMEVIARGRLNVYVPRGEYQFSVEQLQPKGIGPLELAFQQLREKLFTKGYFDAKRKKRLPRFPKRVVLVTSPTGAAVRDMLEVLGRRWPAAEVWVCPVPVQGDGAGLKIAEAIQRLNRIRGPALPGDLGGPGTPGGTGQGASPIDVLIVGRGGGSLEDLWAFNEECVAQAIFASHIPVVSGVGHETDHTIADMVADVRALTPTEAAERVVPSRDELLDGLRTMQGQMRALLQQRVARVRQWLDDVARRRYFRQPLERVRDEERRLDDWSDRLARALRQRLVLARQRVEKEAARLETLSPLNVLSRGYSLTRKEVDATVVRSAEQVQLGDRLVTTVQHGRIVSRVETFEDAGPAAS
jgi:exodeoxyribonuclease VII large subunit